MTTRIENGTTVITADEGRTFIRKSDGFDMGGEIWLGMNHQISPPKMDTPEDFEEEEINEKELKYGKNDI